MNFRECRGDRPKTPDPGEDGGGSGGSDGPQCDFDLIAQRCVNVPGGPRRPAPPTEIPESEFQTFDIPAPVVHAWPHDWAVIGRPAAFWTTAETSYIDMTLLSYAVTVKVTPEEYSWDFGDGTGETTSKKGVKPRPGDEPQVGHDFHAVGPTTVHMTASYSGEFSVDGGPWMPIDGRAHVRSNELSIDVYRFHRYLVDDDCQANPHGPDCN